MSATEKTRRQEPFLTTLQRKWCKTCARLWKIGPDYSSSGVIDYASAILDPASSWDHV